MGFFNHALSLSAIASIILSTGLCGPLKEVAADPFTPQHGIKSPRQSNPGPSFTPIIGVPQRVVTRRPVEVLQAEYPDVFNMFSLALQSLQARPESSDVSYYQLSGGRFSSQGLSIKLILPIGIHGYPYTPWQYPAANTVNPGYGYCTHQSSIFTTWHRPYMVLLEQLLHEEALTLAAKFKDPAQKAKYTAAADDVRLPYWDWASDTQQHIPSVLLQTSLTVVKPDSAGVGRTTVIQNPLYSYRFQNAQPPGSPLGTRTTRRTSADAEIFSSFSSRKQEVLNLFSYPEFNPFSSELENIHGVVHVTVGGDMAGVAGAAFDPIFWLHHCQVDRLFAMYQSTHPGQYLTPLPRSPTFALSGQGPDDLFTALYPFRHPDGKEWTSDDIKTSDSIFSYGYAYPEVPPTASNLPSFVTQQANKLFAPDLDDPSFKGNASGAPQKSTARREWIANVLCDSEEISGSYQILIYIGNPGQNNLAGAAAVFSGSQMATPNRYRNISIPLTNTLLDKEYDLTPDDVVPKLTEQLQWVVQKVGTGEGGPETVPTSDLKSLKVAISSTITEYSKDDTKLPVKTDPQTHYEPTVGKPGGLQPDDLPVVGTKAPEVANVTTP
ncbi:MAG: hypothetical protein M1833_002418 [Piccolia ochrophora]|nr:MAG: hypothetical protein M1833_002418 [Piccolia ochrophora]